MGMIDQALNMMDNKMETDEEKNSQNLFLF